MHSDHIYSSLAFLSPPKAPAKQYNDVPMSWRQPWGYDWISIALNDRELVPGTVNLAKAGKVRHLRRKLTMTILLNDTGSICFLNSYLDTHRLVQSSGYLKETSQG